MKKLNLNELNNYINKKVYKAQLDEIYDIKIILANAGRDSIGSYGILVFFDKEYSAEILNRVRQTNKPAIYICNKEENLEEENIHYAE